LHHNRLMIVLSIQSWCRLCLHVPFPWLTVHHWE
jgi:hypothetical protein